MRRHKVLKSVNLPSQVFSIQYSTAQKSEIRTKPVFKSPLEIVLTSVKLDLPNQITLLQSTAKKLYHFVQIKKIVSRCFGNQSKILIPLFWDLNKIVSPCLKKKIVRVPGAETKAPNLKSQPTSNKSKSRQVVDQRRIRALTFSNLL